MPLRARDTIWILALCAVSCAPATPQQQALPDKLQLQQELPEEPQRQVRKQPREIAPYQQPDVLAQFDPKTYKVSGLRQKSHQPVPNAKISPDAWLPEVGTIRALYKEISREFSEAGPLVNQIFEWKAQFIFERAQSLATQGKIEAAGRLFVVILSAYPGTDFAPKAKKRLGELRAQKISDETPPRAEAYVRERERDSERVLASAEAQDQAEMEREDARTREEAQRYETLANKLRAIMEGASHILAVEANEQFILKQAGKNTSLDRGLRDSMLLLQKCAHDAWLAAATRSPLVLDNAYKRLASAFDRFGSGRRKGKGRIQRETRGNLNLPDGIGNWPADYRSAGGSP